MINNLKSFVRNHFGFSKAETNGMILLFPVILLTIFSPFLINQYFQLSNRETIFDEKSALIWKKELENNIVIQPTAKKNSIPIPEKPKAAIKKFAFNPNTISKKEILELGFSERVAGNWSKFIAAGGKFQSQKDLLKVYGMDSTHLSSLHSYLRFDPVKAENSVRKEFKKKEFKPFTMTFKEKNLNKTDTVDLKKISGVGERLSKRILKFRDKLGGFHSMEQLNDIYGLDSMVIEKIALQFHLTDSIKKIDINQITEKELALHPYFSYKISRVIINYREQHGPYRETGDLKKIHILNDSIISKISPYLQFD